MPVVPTESDPIQNRRLTSQCWDGDHHKGANGCAGWFPCEVHRKEKCPPGCAYSLRCECLCHESTAAPKTRKLKPSDSLDLPDVGSISV